MSKYKVKDEAAVAAATSGTMGCDAPLSMWLGECHELAAGYLSALPTMREGMHRKRGWLSRESPRVIGERADAWAAGVREKLPNESRLAFLICYGRGERLDAKATWSPITIGGCMHHFLDDGVRAGIFPEPPL